MTITENADYDEALHRLHRTGPEFEGYLSNHAPMVVELLARRGADDRILGWTDGYVGRLEEMPRPTGPIGATQWRALLGRSDRVADWVALLDVELQQAPWREVLARWWPRLLPGIAAGATHGVIRTGHAVRALAAHETPERRAELAHALGYWAARWLPAPVVTPAGSRRPAEVPALLDALVDDAVRGYGAFARGNPTMLVHSATAPNAVAAALPSLPRSLWVDSYAAACSASAAIVSAYAPAQPSTPPEMPATAGDVLERALAHGGEHVLKFADAALSSYERTADPAALQAALVAVRLDA